jgi:Na+/alanine symporter
MTPLRLRQIGLVVAGLGCLFFIWGSALILMASRSYEGASASKHRTEKVTHLIGGALLAAGFALQLIAFYI